MGEITDLETQKKLGYLHKELAKDLAVAAGEKAVTLVVTIAQWLQWYLFSETASDTYE